MTNPLPTAKPIQTAVPAILTAVPDPNSTNAAVVAAIQGLRVITQQPTQISNLRADTHGSSNADTDGSTNNVREIITGVVPVVVLLDSPEAQVGSQAICFNLQQQLNACTPRAATKLGKAAYFAWMLPIRVADTTLSTLAVCVLSTLNCHGGLASFNERRLEQLAAVTNISSAATSAGCVLLGPTYGWAILPGSLVASCCLSNDIAKACNHLGHPNS